MLDLLARLGDRRGLFGLCVSDILELLSAFMNGSSRVFGLPHKINLWGRIVMRVAGRSLVSKHNRRSRWFYNTICGFYDWLFLVRVWGYAHSANRLVDELVENDDLVVDLGCGTGLVAHLAAKRAKQVVGVDHAKGMLRRAGRKGRHLGNVGYVVGDCRALPLSGPFDVVLSSFMLVILKEHERRIVIRDAYQLLRPGGRLGLLSSQDGLSDEWYTPSRWTSLLRRAGFEDIGITDLNEAFRIVSARRPSNI